jgi:hypothetical protein
MRLLVLVALLATACFRPAITDGGFRCADGGVCPEGFVCDFNAGAVCVQRLSEGGVAGGGAGGRGVAGAGGSGGEPKLAGTLEACAVSNRGTPDQSDNCEPGNVCIEGESCFPRCFRLCDSDQGCVDAFCDRVAPSGAKVCGVANVDTCSPLMVPRNSGCGVGMACYLSATHPDHTFCDCPLGNGTTGADCSRSRDCNPGLACAYILSLGRATCQQTCELAGGGSECVNGGNCRQYRGASGDEAPHPRWGFCI